MNPADRQALILETAHKAFASDSYQNVSVAQVAAECGVSVALVHKYFESKSGLFAAVLADSFSQLRAKQNAYLQDKTIKRDQVKAMIEAHLDFVAELARPFEVGHVLNGHDDEKAAEVRRLEERTFTAKMIAIVQPNDSARDFYAIQAFYGQMQAATKAWVQRGCKPEEKHPVMDVVLGGLEGALGDWSR